MWKVHQSVICYAQASACVTKLTLQKCYDVQWKNGVFEAMHDGNALRKIDPMKMWSNFVKTPSFQSLD